MLIGIYITISPVNAPKTAGGSDIMTANSALQLSYCTARHKNPNTTAIQITSANSPAFSAENTPALTTYMYTLQG